MCALFGYLDCGKKIPHKVLQKLVQALANASAVRGSFTFTILDERNNLYFVKGSSPLYLVYFPDFGLYVYASTAGIMHKALKAVSLNHLNYEVIEVQDGEILKISKNGSLSRDAFTPAPDFCFGRYQRSIFGWDEEVPERTDDYAILLEMCGYFRVTPEEVQQLIDLGFSYDEIEMMLWEPEGGGGGVGDGMNAGSGGTTPLDFLPEVCYTINKIQHRDCEVKRMKQKSIPIGIEDFKDIIERNCYFVDKSLLIRDLLDSGSKVNLFTRPRRFGKTLNMSMIQRFFEKTDEDHTCLFEGLNITKAGENYLAHQGKYPVVTLSLKGMKMDTFEAAIKQFGWMLSLEFQRHPEILQSDLVSPEEKSLYQRIAGWNAGMEDYCASVQFLTKNLTKIHGRRTIVLIDEYDVPLENAHFCGFYEEMVGFIRSLFNNALKTNSSLEMAVLTGCLRISKESLFTGLNNLQIHSIQTESYSEYFGFTETEVWEMAEYYGLSAYFPTIKAWYDGYRFGETEIYNPWSVLNFMQALSSSAKALPVPYWSNTSSNEIIRKLISEASADTRDKIESLINGQSVKAPIHEDIVYADIDVNEESIWSFLLFTGYLKQIDSRIEDDEIWLELVIPNKEIRSIYRRSIRQWFQDKTRAVSREHLIDALVHEDVDTANRIIGTWLNETISFFDEKEQYYHGFLAGLLSGYDAYKLKSNRETGDGRTDLLLMERFDRNIAVVIEVKDVDAQKGETLEMMAENALRQIEEKHYTEEPVNEGYQKILRYGIAFMGKRCLIKKG